MFNIIYKEYLNRSKNLFKEKEFIIELIDFLEKEKNFIKLNEDLKNLLEEKKEDNYLEFEIFLKNNIGGVAVMKQILEIFLNYLIIEDSFLYGKNYMEILTNENLFLYNEYNYLFLKYLLYYPLYSNLEELYNFINNEDEFRKSLKNFKNNYKIYYSGDLTDIYLENYIHRINKSIKLNNEILDIIHETLDDLKTKEIFKNFNMTEVYKKLKVLDDEIDKEIFIAKLDNIISPTLENTIKKLFYNKEKYEFLRKNFEKVLKILVEEYEIN